MSEINLYYLLSSLPILNLNETAPITIDQFNLICLEHLSKKSYNQIFSINLTPSLEEVIHLQAVQSFYSWERLLRQKLVKTWSSEDSLSGHLDHLDYFDIDRVISVLKKVSSPLEREILLDQYRYNFLENLEVSNFFNLDLLAIYYLKLQIIDKKSSYNPKVGLERFNYYFNQSFIDLNR